MRKSERPLLSFPDWREKSIELPEQGYTSPAFLYTFFPNSQEAKMLAQATPEDMARLIEKQPDLTSRFIYELFVEGRPEVAQETVDLLGGAETAADFVNHDFRKALIMLTLNFVPEDEIQRFIAGIHELGLSNIEDSRWNNLTRVDKKRLAQVKKAVPTREALDEYVAKYNAGQLNRYKYVQYTNDFRIVDPRRGLGFVGLGNIESYDWVNISGVSGFKNTAHYIAPDQGTNIALLSVSSVL